MTTQADPPAEDPVVHDMTVGHPQRWTILGILCLCLILVVAAVSSLNVAIPSIVRALDADQTEQLWIIDAYGLVFAGFLLFAGALGDRFGRKLALLSGLTLFAGAAVVASQAADPAQLIALRAVMGIGAALIMPATLSILTHVFPPQERGKAIAVWAGFAGAGGAIGPLMSGLLLEHYWWGSVLFINVPIALVAFVAIAAFVPSSRDADELPLDPVGAVLSIVGLAALVYGIINGGEHGWTEPRALAGFAVGLVGLAAFVRYELHLDHPMLDPRLFRLRRLSLGSFTITAAFAVMFGMFYLVTLYLQFVQGYSPLAAAVHQIPFAITMLIVSPQGPRLVARFGARTMVTFGLLVQATAFVILSTLRPDTPYAVLFVGLVLLGIGLANLMPPSTEAIVSSLPPSKAGVGSAINDTTREVGGALGIAVLGSLLSMGYRNGLGSLLDQLPASAAGLARDSIAGAIAVGTSAQAPDGVGAQLVEAAKVAQTDGMRLAFLAAAAIGVVAAVLVNRLWPTEPLASAAEREALVAD